MMRWLLVLACLCALVGSTRHAHADTTTRSTFALVVTSNRSARLARPDLRYADDDGAKYYEMFRMMAPEANVRLLTTFDADTEKLFPDLVTKAKPPTRSSVLAAAAELASAAAAARVNGPVDFYFVYAGHGDIQGGQGFLDLPDAAFTADDLEALLARMPMAQSHVILDSCNSFFVVNSRKPGGRHFVTSEEASKSLGARLPNVGVFLSTSAEAEVFEWSELQSGIFSHAVRSGLSGAADVNHDGHVSYDELRAFVSVAAKDVKNPVYRPQVFARGPGSHGDATLFDVSAAHGTRIGLDSSRKRITVRDANELPWFDFHKEAGDVATLVLPARVAAGASIDVLDGEGRGRHSLESPAAPEVMLAALAASPAPHEARGADDLFKSLFAQPFGPAAFATAKAEEREPTALVLGASSDERERMRLLLGEASDSGRRSRQVYGSLRLATNLGIGAAGGIVLAQGIRDKDVPVDIVGGALIALSLWGGTSSVIELVGPSLEERTLDDFVHDTATDPSSSYSYALAERRLLASAAWDHKHRILSRWLGFIELVSSATSLTGSFIAESGDGRHPNPAFVTLLGGTTVLGAALFAQSFFPTTTERMAEIWANDPSRARLRPASSFTVKPTVGLGGLGLTGSW